MTGSAGKQAEAPGRREPAANGACDEVSALVETRDVRLLMDLGILALSAGLAGHARAIFDGVRAARPGEEAGPIGLALCMLSAGAFDDAVAILRPLPPSDAVRTYLGMALLRQGNRREAMDVLGAVSGTASPFARLASDLMTGEAT